jgi:CubicO group peptidase (beta-lactamase class C family)
VSGGVELHGFCEPIFAPLKAAFAANFADGLEVGASLAATHQGRMVCDLWAGWADGARTKPWAEDTIVRLFSTTKVPLIFCLLRLIDQGKIALDAPVARYWPEFAAGGKSRVTVRHAMTHQGGVPGLNPPIVTGRELYDWDAMCAQIAADEHWFGGALRYCYHFTTYGYLLGELIRRVDGRMPSAYFAEEFARPGAIDLAMPLPNAAELARTAELVMLAMPTEPPPPPSDPIVARALASSGMNLDLAVSLQEWNLARCALAEIPAGGGYGNGRSVARLGAVAAMGGELDGRRYFSEAILREATALQAWRNDEYFGWINMGLGFGLNADGFRAPSATAFHWGGYGGSFCIMDRATGVSCGYAMNDMIVDDLLGLGGRNGRLWAALGETMAAVRAEM